MTFSPITPLSQNVSPFQAESTQRGTQRVLLQEQRRYQSDIFFGRSSPKEQSEESEKRGVGRLGKFGFWLAGAAALLAIVSSGAGNDGDSSSVKRAKLAGVDDDAEVESEKPQVDERPLEMAAQGNR